MAEQSNISWCDSTFSTHNGCTKKSDGCKNCYAKAMMDDRFGKVQWGPLGIRTRTSKFMWDQVRKWDKAHFVECMACGWRSVYKSGLCPGCNAPLYATKRIARRRVFANSLSDIFEDRVEIIWRDEALGMMSECTNLDFLILTKYPENMLQMFPVFPDHMAIGVSVENHKYANERIPLLLQAQAKTKFLSVEPMLEPIRLDSYLDHLSLVICGAESGPDRRHYDPLWGESLYRECKQSHVKFFMKQGSALRPGQQSNIPDWLWKVKEFPVIGG